MRSATSTHCPVPLVKLDVRQTMSSLVITHLRAPARYHHFAGGKTDLFRAVLGQVQDQVGAVVAAAADAVTGPWEQLVAGCRAFLAASIDPAVRRIMLVDGPAVLGWHEWRALDEATSARHLHESLGGLIASGVLVDQPVAPLTRLLSGALNEAALWLAESADPAADLAVVEAALVRMLAAQRAG